MSTLTTVPHDTQEFLRRVENCLRNDVCRRREEASRYDLFRALALAIREHLMEGLFRTQDRYEAADAKRLYYLSLEFLIGRSLALNILNLQIESLCRRVASVMGLDLQELLEAEPDAALGNGGLGRLAACFLDSLATLGMPAYGYGINYEYGLFRQEIENGNQREKPDHWLSEESPWTVRHADRALIVPLYGHVVEGRDRRGEYNPMWLDWKIVIGIPHDILICGYGGQTVNMLRLYSARSSDEFDMRIFNQGDYISAVQQKISTETVSKVLYPSDAVRAGKELRLIQEYFLVACAVRDITRRFQRLHTDIRQFPNKVAIQLNDTHPALTIAELMRMFVDEFEMPWEEAWEVTQATCGYTNHTLMPEALEKWPVSLLETVLPRHLQVIQEINHRFLRQVSARWPGDQGRLARMSLIEEGVDSQVRMAHLSILGSHSVNGVAALHTELVKKTLVPDFYEFEPHKFNNKTNGVTHRRWLLGANTRLASLITQRIGTDWITDAERLRQLEPLADDEDFRQDFLGVKRANKERLARYVYDQVRLRVDPASLFDVQVKRIHEYKRQLLCVMHIIHQYFSLVEEGRALTIPRTYLLAGKAAPGYVMAKLVIKLIHNVAARVNNDPRNDGQLRVVFLPDYNVSLAEKIMPAAELSEQISTAGREASGTGNMKLAMNGALTMGTLDGANIEIMERVGAENIYIFGLTADQINEMRESGSYRPWDYYFRSPAARRVMDAIGGDYFSHVERGVFQPIHDAILKGGDPYFHLADLDSYIETQERAARDYLDRPAWARKAVLNVARTGWFSSDRTVREYASEIWGIGPVE